MESDNGDEDNDEEGCHSINPEEQWSKPSPLRQTKSKGNYLTPTNKKLNFNPVLPSTGRKIRFAIHSQPGAKMQLL